MDEKILEKMLSMGERFFGTVVDSEQMPVTKESYYKLQKLHPKTVVYRIEHGEPVSWVVVLPTSTELAGQFLRGKINERELLDLTKPQDEYEALYLCAAFTVPEYRRKGYVLELFKEAVNGIPHVSDAMLFAWPFSDEGRRVMEKAETIFGIKIVQKR